MASLHSRCQASTALLSVINSCESSMSRAPPAFIALDASSRRWSSLGYPIFHGRAWALQATPYASNAVSTELTRGSRSAPLRGDPSTLVRNPRFRPNESAVPAAGAGRHRDCTAAARERNKGAFPRKAKAKTELITCRHASKKWKF